MQQYGEFVVPPRSGRRGRPRKPYVRWRAGSVYATVSKQYRKGRVAAVSRKLVHGTREDLAAGLAASPASGKVNTAFVEETVRLVSNVMVFEPETTIKPVG